ncbi:MAG: lysylphosphatidylglycerol synthase transmembrane domain-containing protein [Chloracidobacterium sp.]|uniref:Flippase-like domain-containing protein n=1 Tax=Chloracidobacterium validum TaxID=2821543 RepID=A0ABX8BBU1_9BACT|nr:lysylphosphatidylglycerol synthase transmembrane domain-containing protein [Chloracidobacterium validum]QUW04403.1 flippase-like domain-containing protein [Chloracidobacterium validum]
MKPGTRSARQTAWTVAKWLALAGLLALAARTGHLAAVGLAFRDADWRWIGAALGLGGAMLVIRAAKWRWLLMRVRAETSRLTASRSLLCGMALGLVTPGRVGELGRAAFLPPGMRTAAAGLFLIDRATDVAALGAAACFGTLAVAPPDWRWPLAAAGCSALLLVFTLPVGLPALLAARYLPAWLRERLYPAAAALKRLRHRDIAANLIAAVLLTGLDVVSLYVLARAFEPVGFAVIAFAFPWILLSNLIPITPAGIGVREGTAAVILHAHGVGVPTAVNASLLLFAINTLAPALVGLAWMTTAGQAPATVENPTTQSNVPPAR